MAANNETGALQPVAEAAAIVHEARGLLHVDAIQALGKIPFDIKAIGTDLATFSAHKIGGPKGVGALVVADGVAGLEPVLRGGGQELNRRAGTENVAGIAGFGAAVRIALQALPEDAERMVTLRDRLENGIRRVTGAIVFSNDVERLPNTVLFTAPRPEGRDRGDRLRPGRRGGILGLSLFLGQGAAVSRAVGNGV
ncbi:cysteine sulfinate desulfinase/cysteine desulfurase-like protein [Bradyrhizobium sp. LM6.11]